MADSQQPEPRAFNLEYDPEYAQALEGLHADMIAFLDGRGLSAMTVAMPDAPGTRSYGALSHEKARALILGLVPRCGGIIEIVATL